MVTYFLSSNTHVTGPYTKEELLESLKYGVVARDSTICEEGSDEWMPISVLFGEKAGPAVLIEPEKPAGSGDPENEEVNPFTALQESQVNASEVYHDYYKTRSPKLATWLEVVGGCFQIFGIGNIYAGRLWWGILLMIGYWILLVINILLVFVFLIGIVTGALTWIAFLATSIYTARKAINEGNFNLIVSGQKKVEV